MRLARSNRRQFLLATSGTAAALALGSRRPAHAQAPKTLVVASNQEIPNFDPHTASGYAPDMFMRNTYEALVRIDGNPPTIGPSLAESWDVAPDSRRYTFRLNAAARFADGAPVDAAAVAYSFKRAMRLGRGQSWMLAGILEEGGVRVVDPQTIEFALSSPFSPFLQVLPWQWVVNPRVVEANLGNDSGETFLRRATAGSGPFAIERAEPGNLYLFNKRADYWRGQGGNVGRVIWKVTREAATQRLLVQRGEAQIAIDMNGDDIDAMRGRPGIRTIVEPYFYVFTFKMNTRHGPLMDRKLRQAISYAFDYEELQRVARYTAPLKGPLPEGMFGFKPDLAIPRTDLERARALLAQTEFAAGGRLSIKYITGLDYQRQWTAVLLSSLRRIGIELDVGTLPWVDLVASARSPQTMADFFPVFQGAFYADPDCLLYQSYHSARNGTFTNPVYANPEIDQLIAQGRAVAAPAERSRIYGALQEKLVEDAPDIFALVDTLRFLMRDNVDGWAFCPIAPKSVEYHRLSLT
jgi:peptide/nickel transport system substrate-binding protein